MTVQDIGNNIPTTSVTPYIVLSILLAVYSQLAHASNNICQPVVPKSLIGSVMVMLHEVSIHFL